MEILNYVQPEFERFLSLLRDGLGRRDPTMIGVLVAVGLVLLTIVVLLVLNRKRTKRRGVLLVGTCDAGKTLVFSQLVHRMFRPTFTSTQTNSGMYQAASRKLLRIIDLPGHERLRGQYLEEYRRVARGIAFVVDSVGFQKELKDVAEYLYTVLSDGVISQHAPPVLIVCNKQDQALAKSAKAIKSLLEEEIGALRVSRSAALSGLGSVGNNSVFLGRADKEFEFADVLPLRVEFAEVSALSRENKPNLEELLNWIDRLV